MDPRSNLIIISVGGSLIIPGSVDIGFLGKFKRYILTHVNNGLRFVIISGGGKTARIYQQAAREVSEVTAEGLDWIGIHSTRLNAHLLRTIFHGHAHPRIIKDPNSDVDFTEDILLAAGWKPGCSTDYDAVLIAKKMGATKVINLSNIDYVYDKDPNEFPDAVKIEKIGWAAFRKLIPDHWDPGLRGPFDPVAAAEAEKIGLEVAVINGNDLEELDNYISGKSFKGTLIKSK